MTVTTKDGTTFMDDGKCPICGAETCMSVSFLGEDGVDDVTFECIMCPKCGDIMDAVFDGMVVNWENLDHSHDND